MRQWIVTLIATVSFLIGAFLGISLSPSKQPADYFSFDAEYTITVLKGYGKQTILNLPMDQCGSRIIVINGIEEGDCIDDLEQLHDDDIVVVPGGTWYEFSPDAIGEPRTQKGDIVE